MDIFAYNSENNSCDVCSDGDTKYSSNSRSASTSGSSSIDLSVVVAVNF